MSQFSDHTMHIIVAAFSCRADKDQEHYRIQWRTVQHSELVSRIEHLNKQVEHVDKAANLPMGFWPKLYSLACPRFG